MKYSASIKKVCIAIYLENNSNYLNYGAACLFEVGDEFHFNFMCREILDKACDIELSDLTHQPKKIFLLKRNLTEKTILKGK